MSRLGSIDITNLTSPGDETPLYRQSGWIGTLEVNRDMFLSTSEAFVAYVPIQVQVQVHSTIWVGLRRVDIVSIHLHCPDLPRLTVLHSIDLLYGQTD